LTGARAVRLAWLGAGPGALYLLAFFVAPLGFITRYALAPAAPGGGVASGVSLEAIATLANPDYVRVFLRSAGLAGIATGLTFLIAWPVAWAIATLPRGRRLLPLLVIVVPAWINLLIKNYAWIILLRREGPLNGLLVSTGLTGQPLPLLFNQGAVIVGLVHSYLPFMLLPVYAAMERLDPSLLEAARDLGARPGQVLRRVVWPQTRRGTAAGAIFVFVLALGAFVTPDLLGGARGLMIGNLIQNQILQVRNWPLGAALALALMGIVLGLIGLLALARREDGGAGGREAAAA
jgi:spermidine/putrescine transport system permease protein